MSRDNLHQLLAPSALRVLFQPVVDVSSVPPKVHSFAALTRGPAGSSFERTDVLSDYVRLRRVEAAVDRASVVAACLAARDLPAQSLVSLGVHAATLSRDPEFLVFLGDCLTDNLIAASRLIVEVVEPGPHAGDSQLRESLSALRHIGAAVALDGVGVGQSDFRVMLELRPEYLKLDWQVVQHCHADFRRAAVIESLALLGRRLGARLVADGVESIGDLAAVQTAGVELIQGHLISPAVLASELARLELCDLERPGATRPGLGETAPAPHGANQ